MLVSLTQREQDTLNLIIQAYIMTAEPVASRILVQSFNVRLSSATIRNVMSCLEQKGYIRQLHTSSGRVPTDEGYRFYVEYLLPEKKMTREEEERIDRKYFFKKREVESVMNQAARALASSNECTAIVSMPLLYEDNIQRVKMVRIDQRRVMVIVLFSNGMVRQKIVKLAFPESDQDLASLANLLMYRLRGETLDAMADLATQALTDELVKLDIFHVSEDLVIQGWENLTKYPEFCHYHILSNFIRMLDEKTELLRLLRDSLRRDKVNIYIGEQGPGFDDYSIVTANYGSDQRGSGSLGVIGPKRMRYDRVIAHVEGVADSVSRALAWADADY